MYKSRSSSRNPPQLLLWGQFFFLKLSSVLDHILFRLSQHKLYIDRPWLACNFLPNLVGCFEMFWLDISWFQSVMENLECFVLALLCQLKRIRWLLNEKKFNVVPLRILLAPFRHLLCKLCIEDRFLDLCFHIFLSLLTLAELSFQPGILNSLYCHWAGLVLIRQWTVFMYNVSVLVESYVSTWP